MDWLEQSNFVFVLLPVLMLKRYYCRRWSKKYPICIKLDPDQVYIPHPRKESVPFHESKIKVGEKLEHRVGFKKSIAKVTIFSL